MLTAAFAFAGVAACETPSTSPGARASAEPACTLATRARSSDALRLILEDADRALAEKSTAGYERAIDRYRSAGADSRYRLNAYTGLGNAYLGLATAGAGSQTDNYRNASACFLQASALASAGEAKAAAHDGRAEALMALHTLAVPPPQGADRYIVAAIAEYDDAVDANATATRRFNLGRAYLQDNRRDDAARQFELGVSLAPQGRQRAEALVALADIVGAGVPPAAEADDRALQALVDAVAADSTYTMARAKLGARFFERSNFSRARAELTPVVDPNAQVDASARAEANYYLSVIDSLDSTSNTSLESAVTRAEEAVRLGGGVPRFRRQACLAYIVRGRPTSGDDPMGRLVADLANRCQGDVSPEGRLLSGMSYLRLAQYPNAAGNSTTALTRFRSARTEFEQGLAAAPTGGRVESRMLAWPGQRAISVRDLLEFGTRVIVEQCVNVEPNRAAFPLETPGVGMGDLGGYYSAYRVFACVPQS
jgi:tetratricopeptide (TPR) repeat protein